MSRGALHLPFIPVVALVGLVLGTSASATSFTYDLASHPDGGAEPPAYGLRLDELFDVTLDHDRWTFDFDDAQSNMKLVYDDGGTPGDGALGDDTVRIFGTVFGGLDTGTGYDDPLRRGLWDVDFTYNSNLQSAGAGGVDVMVNPDSPSNNGSITPQFAVGGDGSTTGVPIALTDEDGGKGHSFKFNNTDDHRLAGTGLSGPDTFVGWGWLNYGGEPHVSASDWLFIATVPEPGTSTLLGAALVAVLSHRRRRAH